MPLNRFGQPVGEDLSHWEQPPYPPSVALEGAWCRLEPLDPARHGDALWDAFGEAEDGRDWTYLSWGPFEERARFDGWLEEIADEAHGPFKVVVVGGAACGMGAYLSIAPSNGSIEIGHLHFAPRLRGTAAGTEALHLWIDHAFQLGYRRVEWKCDALNAASRQSARRLGFSFEGLFLNHRRFKGRSRDTAWYAITDDAWPALRAVHRAWLDPGNFGVDGTQRCSLAAATAGLRRPAPVDEPN